MNDHEKREREIKKQIDDYVLRGIFINEAKSSMFIQVGAVDSKGNVSDKPNSNPKHAISYYSLGVWMPYGVRGETALGASKIIPFFVIGGPDLFLFMAARFAKGYPTLPLLTVKMYMTIHATSDTAVGRIDLFDTKVSSFYLNSITLDNKLQQIVAIDFTYQKAEITHLNYNEYDQKHSSKFLIGVPGEPQKSPAAK